jgi:hypothetical protein
MVQSGKVKRLIRVRRKERRKERNTEREKE